MLTHPQVVHFPIALLLVAFLFEIIGLIFKKEDFIKFAFYILILAALAGVAAVYTGDSAEESLQNSQPFQGLLHDHESNGELLRNFILLLVLLKGLMLYFKNHSLWFRIPFVVLLFCACVILYQTARMGGTLVYKYGAGVETNQSAVPDSLGGEPPD